MSPPLPPLRTPRPTPVPVTLVALTRPPAPPPPAPPQPPAAVVFNAVRPVDSDSPAAAPAEAPAAAERAADDAPPAAAGAFPAAANHVSPAATGSSPAAAIAASPRRAAARHPRRGGRPAAGAWPAETRDAWRCEIAWDSGYRTSRFQAVVREPGQRRATVAARSQAFKWLLDGPPKKDRPEFEAAVRSLDAALVGAGWRRIPPGPKWYAQRYVWPGAEAPGALHYTS